MYKRRLKNKKFRRKKNSKFNKIGMSMKVIELNSKEGLDDHLIMIHFWFFWLIFYEKGLKINKNKK
jgi:hypothetical protein